MLFSDTIPEMIEELASEFASEKPKEFWK